MKIVHVTPSFYPAHFYGGPIESVYHLCRYLTHYGCEVRVLATDANGPDATLHVEQDRELEVVDRLSVRYCHRFLRHSVSPALLRFLPSYLAWAEVVHLTAVYSFPTLPTLLACKILSKPLVWSPRGAFKRWEGTTHLRFKAVWERVCRLVSPKELVLHVTSEDEARESLERFSGADIVIVPNGIEIPDEVTYIPGDNGLRLLYLGRLHPIKGIENLLSACRILNSRSGIIWSLTIAGTGDLSYAETLKTWIRRLALAHQVRMVGHVGREAKHRLFQQSDIAIVPSYTENFGMVVAEALAHGMPVIASKGTPWQRIEEVGCGLWVDNDPESLARAIEQMSQMPLRKMGQRGREWMEKDFAWPSIATKMAQVYRSLLEGHHAC